MSAAGLAAGLLIVNERLVVPPSGISDAPNDLLMVGGPTTVTRNDLLVVWPSESVALHVTVVVPIGNVAPLGGVQVAGREPAKPVAVAANVTTAPAGPVAATVMSAGTVTVGGSATTSVALAALPAPPSTEVTTDVVLTFVPAVVPVTGRMMVQVAPGGMVIPVTEMRFGAVAVTVPPQNPTLELAIVRPTGSVSV